MLVQKSQFQTSESFNAGSRWLKKSGSYNAGSKSQGDIMHVPKVQEI